LWQLREYRGFFAFLFRLAICGISFFFNADDEKKMDQKTRVFIGVSLFSAPSGSRLFSRLFEDSKTLLQNTVAN